MSRRSRFKTFVTEQKMLLFTQIIILMGLMVQVIMLAALIWYGRPADSSDTALVLQFFYVAALWVITIDIGVVVFWWVSKQGDWPLELSELDELLEEEYTE